MNCVFTSDKDKQFFQTKIILNISARISWSISEILRPLKKLAV